MINHHHPLVQLVKYGIVGVANTLLTLAVIFVCKSMIGLNPYISNALGYGVGLVNSFIWNRQWVFRAKGSMSRHAVLFVTGFAICYLIQLLTVYLLNSSPLGTVELHFAEFTLSGYGIATLIGNVVYTACNFIYNRLVAFKK